MPYKDLKDPRRLAYRKKYAAEKKPWQSDAQKESRRKYRQTQKGLEASQRTAHKYYEKNKDKFIAYRNSNRKYLNAKNIVATKELGDSYILRQLGKAGIPNKVSRQYPELIETERQRLKIVRLIKQKQQ